MLFKHKALFFAYKNVLNDPTDCSPYFYLELSDKELEKRVREIAEDTDGEPEHVRLDAQQILGIFESERGAAPEKKSLQRSRTRNLRFGYVSANEPAANIAKRFVAEHMREQVDEARIFSMSKKHDEPRLWAHYANSHSGLCLELDGLEANHASIILDRVDYTTRRPRISISDIKNMKSHEKTKSEIYNRMFFQKSTGWDYEDEQRLVIPKSKDAEEIAVARFPEGDYIHFGKMKVKAIYFGMNCDPSNGNMVRQLVSQFCQKSKPKTFFASQSEDNYEIKFMSEDDYLDFI